MVEPDELFPHLLVDGRVENHDFTRPGRGDSKVRDVERRTHGQRLQQEVTDALAQQDSQRASFDAQGLRSELESLGVVINIEGAEGYPLRLESLDQLSRHRLAKRPKWLLLSVHPATNDTPERAQVWISDEYRPNFLKLFEKYLTEDHGSSGKPKHRTLVANVAHIRETVLIDLWQSAGDPPTKGRCWWEVWLRPDVNAIHLAKAFAADLQLRMLDKSLKLDNRHVVWIQAQWDDLHALLLSAVPVTELRRPAFVDTVEDLELDVQHKYVTDLAARIVHANATAPAVCLLDTGVRRSHLLIEPSIAANDLHTVVGLPAGDIKGHGTTMAGLALLGPLDSLFNSSRTIRLIHRLESVKFLFDDPYSGHDPAAYGVVTAEAIALPEIENVRRRVFSLPITSPADSPGEPSLWSAAVDALAAGTDIGRTEGAIELLGPPSDDAKRLVIVSAGNVDQPYEMDYLAKCDLSPIEDPAQAWNALVVGASTQLVATPTDPTFVGWTPLAQEGDVSPHSRTGVIAGGDQWPIKPDICMEGGNVLSDGSGDFHDTHPVVSVRTAAHNDDAAIGSVNATSAATAQASRLAARAMATYPEFWPETIRGLLTHTAEWTPTMKAAVLEETAKKRRLRLLKRFGWGVPDDIGVRYSARNAATMVVQDRFVPFTGKKHMMREFRLHELPWPSQELAQLGATDVELRITLSYFIEPSASRRGWRRRYAYASHGLRFELRRPNETTHEFVRRVNRDAASEEDGYRASSGESDKWTVGPNQRNKGSLHQDIWSGHGAELANTGVIAVHAVGGWWKNNKREDRQDFPIRYALLVSLRTPAQNIDLYAPIATMISVPVEAVAVGI